MIIVTALLGLFLTMSQAAWAIGTIDISLPVPEMGVSVGGQIIYGEAILSDKEVLLSGRSQPNAKLVLAIKKDGSLQEKQTRADFNGYWQLELKHLEIANYEITAQREDENSGLFSKSSTLRLRAPEVSNVVSAQANEIRPIFADFSIYPFILPGILVFILCLTGGIVIYHIKSER